MMRDEYGKICLKRVKRHPPYWILRNIQSLEPGDISPAGGGQAGQLVVGEQQVAQLTSHHTQLNHQQQSGSKDQSTC
jgi:hypothetical protein